MFKKKSLMVALSLLIALVLMTTPVLAAQPQKNFGEEIITPFWTNTASAQANLSTSNLTLKPSVYILAYNTSTSITGTLYLEKKSGTSWVTVTSWSISGTGSLTASKSYTGVAGTTYRARAAVSVGGESVECTSGSRTL